MRTRSATCPVGSGTAARREAEYVASEPTATRDRVWSIGKADCSGASIGAKIVGQVRITPVPPYTRHRGCRFRNSGMRGLQRQLLSEPAPHTLWSRMAGAARRLSLTIRTNVCLLPLHAPKRLFRLRPIGPWSGCTGTCRPLIQCARGEAMKTMALTPTSSGGPSLPSGNPCRREHVPARSGARCCFWRTIQ
jgi:hypothetical protein